MNFLVKATNEVTNAKFNAVEYLKREFFDRFGALSPFHVNSIKEEFLSNYVIKIIEILRVCKCQTELQSKLIDTYIDKHYSPLKNKYDALLTEHEDLKKSFEELKHQFLEREFLFSQEIPRN